MTVAMERLDYLVIGGGSGGLASARRAASFGARVALIEAGPLGGTCVNVGCVPKKIMWNAAEIAEEMLLAQSYGFDLEVRGLDFGVLRARREAYIARMRGNYAQNLKKDGVELIAGRGQFVAPGAVRVGEQTFSAKHVLIATGGMPRYPDIVGAQLGTTSDGFFALEALPKRVLLVGAGYIAVELAGIMNKLGSEVTLAMRHERPLRGFDPMLGDGLRTGLEQSGVRVLHGVTVIGVERGANDERIATLADCQILPPFDAIFWAIGRQANTAELGLESAGVRLDLDGHVVVDEFQNTSAAGIYALGDVAGRATLTPVAIAAGRKLAERLFGGKPEAKLDYDDIPSV
ncbi:MAG TPA: FAD-dependent oxidoreductase, partial [Polyangiaceae bacterium]|nr:FAD-dependent oxidoreductase [Polyangiaceae bacterium]